MPCTQLADPSSWLLLRFRTDPISSDEKAEACVHDTAFMLALARL